MIKRMARVRLWGVLGKKTTVVDRLYELGVFHMDIPEGETRNPLLEVLRTQRGKVLGLIEALEWEGWKSVTEAFIENVRYNLSNDPKIMMEEIERSLERIQSRLNRIRESTESMQGDFVELRRANLILSHAQAFLGQERFTRGEIAIWKLPRPGQHLVVSRINGDIDLLPRGHQKPWFRYHSFDLKDGSSFLVTSASREVQPNLRIAVSNAQGILWKLPGRFNEVDFLSALSQIKQILRSIPSQVRENKAELKKLSLQWGANLAAVYVLLDERLEQLLMETAAKENTEFFSLEGWIPENEIERTRTVLKEDFGDAVMMRWRLPDPPKDGVVPTVLQNHPIFKPFELFLKLLRLPHYNAYDPSFLIGLFFPFFAGCMVGDMGYGVLILWLGWYLKQKKSVLFQDIGVILFFIAFWSVAWGLMYGELFGDVGHRLLHMKPIWVDRAHAVPPVMIFSIALGGAHVLLGLLMGMIQGLRNKNRHLWMERAGSLLFILALTSALVMLRSKLPPEFFSVPVLLLVISLVFLIRGGGIGGIIESLGAIGNIISYVRIAAIGLSSAILAMVASTFVDTFGVSILGLFMAFAIHLLNFVLALGGSSLHSARLHYVEFMGKFYEEGTLAYKPFAKRGRRPENPPGIF